MLLGAGAFYGSATFAHLRFVKLWAAAGGIIGLITWLVLPILQTSYEATKARMWAHTEIAKRRAFERARVEIRRAQKAAEGEIVELGNKVDSQKAKAFSEETLMRMKLVVVLGDQTDQVLRLVSSRPWKPQVKAVASRLVLLLAAGSRKVLDGSENASRTHEPFFAVGLLYILTRILFIEVVGLCIAQPWLLLVALAVTSFVCTFLGASVARLI